MPSEDKEAGINVDEQVPAGKLKILCLSFRIILIVTVLIIIYF